MLNKEELLGLGYEFSPDSERPGLYRWDNEDQGTFGAAHETEDDAILGASSEALACGVSRCDNCGKLHTDAMLKLPIKDLAQRVDPNGAMPSGECSDCGCLCYAMEQDPDWGTVMVYFGLDDSFCWTNDHIQDYTRQYLEAIANEERQAEMGRKVMKLLEEADCYLREIRAENLDGSEPALGELLERLTGFWIEADAA